MKNSLINKYNVLFGIGILFAIPAFADTALLLEPGAVLEVGHGNVNFPSPIDTQHGNIYGYGLGLRAGVQLGEIIFVAADGLYTRDYLTLGNYKPNVNSWLLGLTAGVQMPFLVGLRAWASYIPFGVMDMSQSDSVNGKFTDPQGFKLGAGLQVALVSFNLEYMYLDYGHSSLQSVGPTTIGFNSVHFTRSVIMAGVSVPLTL